MSTLPTPIVPHGCPSTLRLDQHVTGELPDDLERHLSACAACRARVDHIELDRERFMQVSDSLVVFPRRRRWHLIGGAGALAAAAIIAILIAPPGAHEPRVEATDGVRLKGPADGTLAVYVQHAGQIRRAGPDERVAPRDALQMTLALRAPRFAAVLGIDARTATVYFPDGPRAEHVSPERELVLPSSIILDDTPGREELVALFCEAPIELEPVRAAMARDRSAVPAGCSEDRLALEKEVR